MAKTIDQLKKQKLDPKYLKMAKSDCDAFRESYAHAIRTLGYNDSRALSETFKGMAAGVHHDDPGMCIIENEKQDVLLILMEKKT